MIDISKKAVQISYFLFKSGQGYGSKPSPAFPPVPGELSQTLTDVALARAEGDAVHSEGLAAALGVAGVEHELQRRRAGGQ